MQAESPITVACIQMEPKIGEKKANVAHSRSCAKQAESPITVACIQMEPKIGEKRANVAHSLDKITEAAGKGAQLIVLPELCNRSDDADGCSAQSRRVQRLLSRPRFWETKASGPR